MDYSAVMEQISRLRKSADARNFDLPEERRKKLTRIYKLIISRSDAAIAALHSDLGRNRQESLITEIFPLLHELRAFARKVKKWSAPRRVPVSLVNLPGRGRLVPEPYGLVLVASVWNLPLLVPLQAAMGAYAAGNKVVLKLSKRAPRSMQFVRWVIEECFSPEDIAVVDDEISLEQLSGLKFDYIFFAGNQENGRKILQKAALKLTPVLLELGGKSPCIVSATADLKVAARRIVRAKFFNAGQNCEAPDLLFADRKIKEKLTNEIRKAIRKFYGNVPLDQMQGLVDDEAYERVVHLAEHGRLITGGDREPAQRILEPTVIDRLEHDDPLLKEEIFGPVLPVIEYDSPEELQALIKTLEKPMAIYYFGREREEILRSTSSGSLVFNDAATQFFNREMPFGGIGESGMGVMHTKYTFDTFSHLKPVMYRSNFPDFPWLYPPFKNWLCTLIARFYGIR